MSLTCALFPATDVDVVRDAVAREALAVAGVHVRSWQVAYRGLIDDGYLDALSVSDRASRYRFDSSDPASPRVRVLERDGDIVGLSITSLDLDDPVLGVLGALYVEPGHWSSGAGRALITDARAVLASLGCSRAALWVLEGNQRAMKFYERDGWRPSGDRRNEERPAVTFVELRYETELA